MTNPYPTASASLFLETKMQPPRSRVMRIERQRLLERLEESGQRPLTVLTAPAGYGKTTLLTAWAERSRHPVAWLSLDSGDNDLRRFLGHLVAAIRRSSAFVGLDYILGLGSLGFSEAVPLVSILVNGLAALEQHLTLILDDVHLIENPDVTKSLELLIENQPSNFRLVLSGRMIPPIGLPRLRVRQGVKELSAEDLRFSPGESERFCNEAMRLGLSREQAPSSTSGLKAGWRGFSSQPSRSASPRIERRSSTSLLVRSGSSWTTWRTRSSPSSLQSLDAFY